MAPLSDDESDGDAFSPSSASDEESDLDDLVPEPPVNPSERGVAQPRHQHKRAKRGAQAKEAKNTAARQTRAQASFMANFLSPRRSTSPTAEPASIAEPSPVAEPSPLAAKAVTEPQTERQTELQKGEGCLRDGVDCMGMYVLRVGFVGTRSHRHSSWAIWM